MRRLAHLPRSLSPLGYRNYALFWIGHATSNTGRWIELTGTVWLVYSLTASPVLTGVLGLVRAVPSFLVSPLAGVVADRVDQRKLLFATQGLAMGAAAVLWILVITDRVELWHIYAQVAFQAGVSAVDGAVRQALFPRLVPADHLTEAVTLSSTAGRTSQLIGPLIGGAAIASLGRCVAVLPQRGHVPRADGRRPGHACRSPGAAGPSVHVPRRAYGRSPLHLQCPGPSRPVTARDRVRVLPDEPRDDHDHRAGDPSRWSRRPRRAPGGAGRRGARWRRLPPLHEGPTAGTLRAGLYADLRRGPRHAGRVDQLPAVVRRPRDRPDFSMLS